MILRDSVLPLISDLRAESQIFKCHLNLMVTQLRFKLIEYKVEIEIFPSIPVSHVCQVVLVFSVLTTAKTDVIKLDKDWVLSFLQP